MIATQVEYRVSLPKRFGPAAFGGIGEVVPGGKEIFRINNFLARIGWGTEVPAKCEVTMSIFALTSPGAKTVGPGAWEWERHFDAERP
jgi:hypothetical protein